MNSRGNVSVIETASCDIETLGNHMLDWMLERVPICDVKCLFYNLRNHDDFTNFLDGNNSDRISTLFF